MAGLREQEELDRLMRNASSGDGFDALIGNLASRDDILEPAPVEPMEAPVAAPQPAPRPMDDVEYEPAPMMMANPPAAPRPAPAAPMPQYDQKAADDAWDRATALGVISAIFSPAASREITARKVADQRRSVDNYNKAVANAQAMRYQESKDDLARQREARMDRQFQFNAPLAQQRVANSTRGVDIRERNLDPYGDWVAARNAENDRRAGRDFDYRREFADYTGNTRRDKLGRAGVMAGNRAVMDEAGVLPPGMRPPRPVRSTGESLAEMYRGLLSTDGEPITPQEEALLSQMAATEDNKSLARQQATMDKYVADKRTRTLEAAEGIQRARRQENIPQTLADIDDFLKTIEQYRDPETGDVPGLSRVDRALAQGADNSMLLAGANIINELAEGDEGAATRSRMQRLRDGLVRMATGMQANAPEEARILKSVAMDWTSSTRALVDAVMALRNKLQEMDAAIVQGYGVEGARVTANRRPGARQVAGDIQSSTNAPGARPNAAVAPPPPPPGSPPVEWVTESGRVAEINSDGFWRYKDGRP